MTVGFIGLGQMGGPMAGHLAMQPEGVVVFDTDPALTAALAEKGGRAAGSAAEVTKEADVVSIMVRDDDQVRAVCAEVLPIAAKGTVLAIHSTIRVGTAEALAVEAAPSGVDVVDAPVSGGFIGAHEGNLAVLAGGSAEAVARCEAAFSPWAEMVVRFGPVGAGTKAKLARNLITFASYAAAAEAQRLAEAAGIDLQSLVSVVRHSDAITGGVVAPLIRNTTAPMAQDDPLREIFEHLRALGEKDLALALELGQELGVDLPFARLALDRFGPGLGLED